MGSITSPPCEEYVVWFIAADPLNIGTTALTMIRNVLNIPDGELSLGP
jgi:carbonic anhydrase